jgi:acetylornithine deacetylase
MKLFLAVVAFASCTTSFAFPPDAQSILDSTVKQEAEVVTASDDDLYKVIESSPVLSLHRALCEVPSVTGNEAAVGELLITFLEAHNFTVTKQPVTSPNYPKPRFNIYAVPDPKKYPHHQSSTSSSHSGPKVILSSHIDTVPPHLNYTLSRPHTSSSRNSILISGRGTVDDKACVAAQTATALSLLSSGTISPSDIALLFVVGEETIGDGMNTFSSSDLFASESSNLKAVLFGEPTELKLATGHKGINLLRVQAHGKAAHSGYPWLGRSANSMILPALMVLDKLGDIPEAEGGLPRSKLFGKSTVNVGVMQGGVAANVVPEYAEASVSFRLAGGTIEEVDQIILNAVRGADPEDELDVELGQGYAPVVCDADVDGFETISVNYGTDVPNLKLEKGVKRYLYGPGSILVAHGANEGLTVGDLEEAVKGYKKLVRHVLAD